MCLEGEMRQVLIPKKIGYAFSLKTTKGEYIPVYKSLFCDDLAQDYYYKKAERSEAKACDDGGGFHFFYSKQAMKHWVEVIGQNRLRERADLSGAFFGLGGGLVRIVGLRCLFEDVFEEGKWGSHKAYRAKYRTILEEVC
jgi:hypothetical protein